MEVTDMGLILGIIALVDVTKNGANYVNEEGMKTASIHVLRVLPDILSSH